MRNVILIGTVILLYTFQSLLCKKYSDNYPGNESMSSSVFTVVSGLFVALASFCLSGFVFAPKPLTILFGVVNAIVLTGYNYSLIRASQTGAYSVLMVFNIGGGIVIPAIVASIAFDDRLSVGKIISILVIFVSVYLMSKKDGEKLSGGKTFIPMCILLALCNGAYGALLDAQQRITGSEDKEEMVAITYFLAMLTSLVMIVVKEKGKTLSTFRQTKMSLFFLLTTSVAVASAIHLLVYILPLVNVTVLYTLDNAGVLLLSVLASCLFFKEKLSRINVIGCITMCAALVCVSIL